MFFQDYVHLSGVKNNGKTLFPIRKIHMNAPWKNNSKALQKFWYTTCRLLHHNCKNTTDAINVLQRNTNLYQLMY